MGDDFFVAAAAAVVIMRMVMEMMEMGISGLKSHTVKPTSRLVKHFEITIIIITTAVLLHLWMETSNKEDQEGLFRRRLPSITIITISRTLRKHFKSRFLHEKTPSHGKW